MSQQERQRPVKEFRAGTISASIWTKTAMVDGRSVDQHNIRIQKRYRDARTGEWKSTSYFQSDDLPKLMLVVGKVYEYVTLKQSDEIPASTVSST